MRFLTVTLLFSQIALAQCPEVIKFADVGWADISTTTEVVREVLKTLNVKSKSINLSVPVTFASLKNKDVDVFLGNWMPSMTEDIKPYVADGSVEVIGPILEGAKYTLAVPSYVFNAGVQDFKDLSRFKQNFEGKIFGLESGNDGNRLVQKMIDEKVYGLDGWKLVESSEQAMVMEVARHVKKNEWIAFLAWQPHPMNKKIDLKYLSGGEAYFGKNQGEAKVFVNLRKGFAKECQLVTNFLNQVKFTVVQENELMDLVITEGKSNEQAAKEWIAKNQNTVSGWLKPRSAG